MVSEIHSEIMLMPTHSTDCIKQTTPNYLPRKRKCARFGINESCPEQVNYIIDEASNTAKGANTMICFIPQLLEYYGLGERKLILHTDNCW